MTIKTLVFIHEQLKHEQKKRYNIYASLRDKATIAKEEKTPNADFLSEQAEHAWNNQTEAARALREFEEKEW